MSVVIDILGSLIFFTGLSLSPAMLLFLFDNKLLKFEDMLKLAKTVAKANPSAPTAYSFGDKTFGYSEMNETLRTEFQELAPDYRNYKINHLKKLSIYEVINFLIY